MKLNELRKIVYQYADKIENDAAYSGMHTDGGASWLRKDFESYELSLLRKHDMKPSELIEFEVGNPFRFKDAITNHYKIVQPTIIFND